MTTSSFDGESRGGVGSGRGWSLSCNVASHAGRDIGGVDRARRRGRGGLRQGARRGAHRLVSTKVTGRGRPVSATDGTGTSIRHRCHHHPPPHRRRRKSSSSRCVGCETWASARPTRVERSITSRSVVSRTAMRWTCKTSSAARSWRSRELRVIASPRSVSAYGAFGFARIAVANASRSPRLRSTMLRTMPRSTAM